MKIITALLSLVFYSQAFSQNLVPNPSFEDTLGCPYQWDGILQGFAANWFQPTWGSSDLFTGCYLVPQSFNGYQYANSGSAYGGVITSCHKPFGCEFPNINREYLSIRLLDSLLPGVTYYGKISVSRADSVQYASNFGVLLSDSLHAENTLNLPYVPHFETTTPQLDKFNWIDYHFSFIASGGEEFITIGNFRDDQNSDTTYTGGGGDSLNWEFLYSYYYIDDVCISQDSLSCYNFTSEVKEDLLAPQLSIYPNPTVNGITISLKNSPHVSKMTIYNMHGKSVLTHYLNPYDEMVQLPLTNLPPALYIIHFLSDSGKIIASRKVLKN